MFNLDANEHWIYKSQINNTSSPVTAITGVIFSYFVVVFILLEVDKRYIYLTKKFEQV